MSKWVVGLVVGGVLVGLGVQSAGFITYQLWRHTGWGPALAISQTKIPDQKLEIALHYFDAGDQEIDYDQQTAIELLEKIVVTETTPTIAQYHLARLYFLQENYEVSLQLLDDYLSTHPDSFNSEALYLKGVVQGFQGDFMAAEQTLERYYLIDAGNWYIHNNLAWVYFSLGKYQKMHAISLAGLLLDPHNPWLLMNRAMAEFNLDRPRKALSLLHDAHAAARNLTEEDWLQTYPGNDPALAQTGLTELSTIIDENLVIVSRAIE